MTDSQTTPQAGEIGALGLPVIPHLDQYVGPWAMYEPAFVGVIEQANRLDLVAHMKSFQQQDGSPMDGNSERVGDVAVINLVGPMTKYGSSLSSLRGGTVGLRRSLRNAVADDDIKAILLKVDSPGGSTAGVGDLADDVWAAAQKKTVWAFIEDLGASAAYFVASQATKVVANPGGLVGSIGSYGVLYDWSALYAKEGIKAYVIKAGEFKGVGVRGTEITESQREETQRTVDQINDLFVATIARGRGIPLQEARKLADGRIHIGSEAQKLGLVNEVGTFDKVLTELGQTVQNPQKGFVMETLNIESTPLSPPVPVQVEPPVASFQGIKEACPGADSAFICAQLECKATVEQVGKAWMAEQATRLAATQKELENAKAVAAKPGVEALGTAVSEGDTDAGDGNPIQAWRSAVDAKVKAGMNRMRAASAVNRERPGLREAFVEASNQARAVA